MFDELSVTQGQHILFVGVGTGADLDILSSSAVKITAIELASARAKVTLEMNIRFIEMDAQNLVFYEQTFDLVVASLILAVVPDANRCMDEIVRVMKEEGTVIIFDKFEPDKGRTSIFGKILRPIISILETDIGRNFQSIIQPYNEKLQIQQDLCYV